LGHRYGGQQSNEEEDIIQKKLYIGTHGEYIVKKWNVIGLFGKYGEENFCFK